MGLISFIASGYVRIGLFHNLIKVICVPECGVQPEHFVITDLETAVARYPSKNDRSGNYALTPQNVLVSNMNRF